MDDVEESEEDIEEDHLEKNNLSKDTSDAIEKALKTILKDSYRVFFRCTRC